MAENKKSVIVYVDWATTFDSLSDEEAGRLIKHFFDYVRDLNPEPIDRITQIAFEPIKQSLKRDLIKYEQKRTQWSDAGKRSAEVRTANKTQQTLTDVKIVQPPLTVSTVSDSVSVSVSVNDSVIVLSKDKTEFSEILSPHVLELGIEKDSFFSYWTEKSKNGKERWECEKFFDISRRVKTWLDRSNKFTPQKTGKLNFDPTPIGADFDVKKAFPNTKVFTNFDK